MLDNLDKYATDNLSVHHVPKQFAPHILPVYPPNNKLIFEEWFAENYVGANTDRVYLPIFPTSFHVNNGYGEKAHELQSYCDTLPDNKKYFTICQYDDGCLVDWKGKDVLEFNMSKTNGIMMPLISQPHPYEFISPKKWTANFVGSKTHPIRDTAELLKNKQGYYISYDSHDIETYCRIIHESLFTLCYRGYGVNSFRCTESLQFGSIPVYISDDFILPFDIDFKKFGVLIHSSEANNIADILESIDPLVIIELQDNLQNVYEKYYTYEGCFNQTIKALEAEYNSRK